MLRYKLRMLSYTQLFILKNRYNNNLIFYTSILKYICINTVFSYPTIVATTLNHQNIQRNWRHTCDFFPYSTEFLFFRIYSRNLLLAYSQTRKIIRWCDLMVRVLYCSNLSKCNCKRVLPSRNNSVNLV